MPKHIRKFPSFQNKRRQQKINESVIQRDDTFIVGGVKVPKKAINAYIKKVKDSVNKDLKSMYSEMEIAEELVRWSVTNLDDVEDVPVSALLGGEDEMAQEIEDGSEETEIGDDGEQDLDIDTEEGINDEPENESENDESEDLGDEDLNLENETEGEGESEEFEEPTEGESEEEEAGIDTEEENTEEPNEEESGEDEGEGESEEDLPL